MTLFQVAVSLVAMLAFAVLLSACSVPSTEIRTSVTVGAPSKVVWEVLTDLDRYPDWNPYHVKVLRKPGKADQSSHLDLPLKKGGGLQVFLHKPDGEKLDLNVTVTALKAGEELSWGGGVSLLFKGEHRFLLVANGPSETELQQDEDFEGLVLPFVRLRADQIRLGYDLVNHAVKRRAEEIFRKDERQSGAE